MYIYTYTYTHSYTHMHISLFFAPSIHVPVQRRTNHFGSHTFTSEAAYLHSRNLTYMGVSLNNGTPQTPQNDDF